MTTEITIKRVEGKSGHYYRASDGAWSTDGIHWCSPNGYFHASPYRIAYKQLIDSEAGGDVEEEPETFTGDARKWGPGVYGNNDYILVVMGPPHDTVIWHGLNIKETTVGWVLKADTCTRLSTNPADFPKILAEHGEGE